MDEKKPSSGTTDLTTGRPLWRILVFALPLVLGTVFQQLYLSLIHISEPTRRS